MKNGICAGEQARRMENLGQHRLFHMKPYALVSPWTGGGDPVTAKGATDQTFISPGVSHGAMFLLGAYLKHLVSSATKG
jgi:hypothetical protein